jgi:antitoxin component of MazEF toxin-antitoxin module
MNRKVFRSGNSLAITLPPEALARMGITEGCEIEVTENVETRTLTLRAADADLADIDLKLMRHLADFVERYRPELEELANR